ncbi:MAG: hypothetical protein HY777_10775 [Betaproteobacteria bacterium]|nr:hypothetical protein [Betaproteobacteria bacterium]
MNKFLPLFAATFIAATSVPVEAVTPKAAENEKLPVALAADTAKPKAGKAAPGDARPTKQAKSTKSNTKNKKTKKSKKPKPGKKSATDY